MKNHQLINQDSGNVEYFTPPEIICAARRTMGGIDVDPATCLTANKTIQATMIYTAEENGLEQEWAGRVWMNHPYARGQNSLWIRKLIDEYQTGFVTQFCCITYQVMSEAWFRPLLDFPQCFPFQRINYYLPDGTIKKGATKGSVITYGGQHIGRFHYEFSKIGVVKFKYGA